MKVIVVAKKRSDFIEIEEIINYFKPEHLCLCIFYNKKVEEFSKITLEYLEEKFSTKVAKIDTFFFEKNIKTGADVCKELYKLLSPQKNVIVLPLLNSFYFLEAAGILKKYKNITVCHISDGILDYVPRYKFFFIKRKINIKNLLKFFIYYIKLFFCESDLSFSIWSNYSAFSKKTIKFKPNLNYKIEIIKRLEPILEKSLEKQELILLIPSHIVNKDILIKHFKLEKSLDGILISNYTGEVTYNNKNYWLNGPMTAEELLQTNYFQKVFSGPSTAAFYAKKLSPNIEVSMISTFKQKNHWGKRQDIWLKKQAVESGINYEYLS